MGTTNDQFDADFERDETGLHVPRRMFLRLGAAGVGAVALALAADGMAPNLRRRGLMSGDGVFDAASIAWADSIYNESFPTSPLILDPFSDELVPPKALAPTPTLEYSGWKSPPGPGVGQQNSLGNERHQIWPGQLGYQTPLVYAIRVQVSTHSFTKSKVLPINSLGKPTVSFDASASSTPQGPLAICRRARSTASTAGFLGR